MQRRFGEPWIKTALITPLTVELAMSPISLSYTTMRSGSMLMTSVRTLSNCGRITHSSCTKKRKNQIYSDSSVVCWEPVWGMLRCLPQLGNSIFLLHDNASCSKRICCKLIKTILICPWETISLIYVCLLMSHRSFLSHCWREHSLQVACLKYKSPNWTQARLPLHKHLMNVFFLLPG